MAMRSSLAHHRAGNALLTAVIVTALAAAAIAISADASVASQRKTMAANHSSNVLAALDVVLARRQRIVLDMAAAGRPEDFATRTDNYGVDFVGPYEVRWKLEPIWARSVNTSGVETAVIENPPPDGATGAPATSLDNPSLFYLYRVAGEARYSTQVQHDAANAANDQVRVSVDATDITTRAQGVRYVSTSNSSVLKYLLYWAQRGPKGDLELSHGPATQLVGHIYSGGSTYLGSGANCNDWLALKGGTGSTTIGPPISAPAWVTGTTYAIGTVVRIGTVYYQAKDAHVAAAANQPGSAGGTWKAYWEDVTACRLESVDGVFRLSKQVMYGAFNGFPMASVAPTGFTLNGSYLLDAIARPGERLGNPTTASFLMPDVATYPGDVFNATYQGRVLNPMRVLDHLATTPLAGADTMRVVNVATASGLTAVPLRGIDEGTANPVAGLPPANAGNDSRDVTRSTASTFQWATHSLLESAPGFNRQVRTRVNGLAEQPLHQRFTGRPEEPQALTYYDLDADATTDEHEYAMPQFVSTTGGTTTDLTQRLAPAAIAGVNLDSVEIPGTYLRETLGGSLYLARRADYRGWLPVNPDGTAPTSEPANGMGIVIRERPRPETTYFTPTALPGPTDPLYMPFAYGHVRASAWPMVACDVASQATNYTATGVDTWTNGFVTTTVAGLTTTNASQSFTSSPSASVTFRAGTETGHYGSSGWSDTPSGYQRYFHLTRDSWRFISLGRPAATTSNGLNATVWNDDAGGTWLMPFGGRPVHSYVESTLNVTWTGAPTGSVGVAADRFAVRWRGFIKPEFTENYTFYLNRAGGHCGVRAWVDDVMVINSWSESTAEVASQPRPLAAGTLCQLVVEAWDTSGNMGLRLDWASPSRARQTIPNDRLFTQTMPEGFDWATFKAVEARLDRISLTNGKAGLMLRPDVGISQVQDGRNPYVALGYTPSRGVFAQIRGDRSRVVSGSQTGYFIGNGNSDEDSNGTWETPMSDANGEIAKAPNHASIQRTATLTPVAYGMSYSATSGSTGSITVYTPGTTNPWLAAPAALGSWPTNAGTSALSGSNWTDTSGSSRTALSRTPDNPFSITEGTVDRVWTGPVTLRRQTLLLERSTAGLDGNIRWHLGRTDGTDRLFRWLASTGDAWPAGWPTKEVASDDIDDTSAASKRVFLFADRTGNRTNNGLFSSSNSAFALGYWYNNWNGWSTEIDTAGTDKGGVITKSLDDNAADTGWKYWFADSNSDGLPDTAFDASSTTGDAKTVYYVNSGGVDTRPKVYNGTTFVRYLTSAETVALMDATYGAGHTVQTTLPSYPTVTAGSYASGDPVAATPTLRAPTMGYTRLAADPTAVSTTLTVNSGINNGTRLYSIGDIVGIHSAAGSEYVQVAGLTDPSLVTVVRGQRGSAAADHPNAALVSQLAMPISAVGAAGAPSGTTTFEVRTLGSAITIAAGDVLQIDGEQMLVTGTTAAVGSTPPSVTVIRGRNGTADVAHAANAAITTPLPVLGRLNAAHTAATTTLTMVTTANLQADDVIQVGTELMQVSAILSGTQATVVRGFGFSAASAYATGATVFLATGKTFAISRSRTVGFEINPWISAGGAPSATWRGLGTSAADSDDWGYTRANDWGWYWSGVKPYAPWHSYWSALDPVGCTGGIASRSYVKTWTGPLTGALPTTDVPVSPDAANPGTAMAAAAGTRFTDDQPAGWLTGASYAVGDLVWRNNLLFKASSNHTASASDAPGTGATWTSRWEQSYVWLRIERVGTTSRVRMLYALGATRPANDGDWRPLLVTPDTAAVADPKPGRVDGDDGDARQLEIDLAPWFKQGRATLSAALAPGVTTVSITAPTIGSFTAGDVIQVSNELMLVTGGAGTSLTVYRNWGGTVTTAGTYPTFGAGTEVVQANWRGNDLLVGLCSQSGSSSSLMDVDASNLRIEQQAPATNLVIDATDWLNAAGTGGPEEDTRYMCSQYQVFWGPYDITEDFFYYGEDGTTPRIATEDWIYNNRYFWSQSRWWDNNEEKDPNYIIPNNGSILSMRELLAKTTMLSINMRALQDYLTSRLVSDAISSRITGAGPTQTLLGADYTLRDRVRSEGLLIHASRYNRYPWNPNIQGQNPWLPGYPLGAATNGGGSAAAPNATSSGYTNASLAAVPTATRPGEYQTIHNLMKTINATNSVTSTQFSDLMPFTLGAGSTPGQLWRTPAIKPQDFHHAVRITDAQNLDWSYGTSTDYETGGISFFTPNQLYIKGDVNITAHSVDFAGVTATKANKLGIYCDAATLLSSSWSDGPFHVPGLVLNLTSRIVELTGTGTLGMQQVAGNSAPTATATRYQFALLTHTSPTTRHTVRMGEASPFISTMQFLENWGGVNMTFVGSIIAMDTRRYSSSYLLESSKSQGLSPFGWMTSGGNPVSATAWVAEYSAANSWPLANVAGWSVNNNGTNITMNNCWSRTAPHIMPIYGAPNRNLYYNPDFSYKPGQPPLMPFGTSAAGMGGWSRIIR